MEQVKFWKVFRGEFTQNGLWPLIKHITVSQRPVYRDLFLMVHLHVGNETGPQVVIKAHHFQRLGC